MDVVYEVLCIYLLGAIVRLIETNIGFVKSVRPWITNRLKMVGHSALWVSEIFNISVENSIWNKNSQIKHNFYEVLWTLMTTCGWMYLNIFRPGSREIKRDCFYFFRKSCRLWENVEKFGTVRQVTGDNIIKVKRIVCWLTTARLQTHSHNV
jgi:hypothetical protein